MHGLLGQSNEGEEHMFLKMKLLAETMPVRAHEGDAGIDLYSRVTKLLEQNEVAYIPLGVAVEIPDGHVGLLDPRSSLLRERGLYGQSGRIDSPYRGELQAVVKNVSGQRTTIWEGERIYQLIVVPLAPIDRVVFTEELSDTDRGNGGFGSTGGYA